MLAGTPCSWGFSGAEYVRRLCGSHRGDEFSFALGQAKKLGVRMHAIEEVACLLMAGAGIHHVMGDVLQIVQKLADNFLQ